MIKTLIASLHPLERKIIPVLNNDMSIEEISKESGLQEIEVTRAIQWMNNKEILTIKEEILETIKIEKNGELYQKIGLPEIRFLKTLNEYDELPENELISKAELSKEEIMVCIGQLKQKQAIDVKKENGLIFKITDNGRKIANEKNELQEFLSKNFPIKKEEMTSDDKKAFDLLIKRKEMVSLDIRKKKTIHLTKIGHELIKQDITSIEVIDKITPQILKEKSWKEKEFRTYDVKINVPKIDYGKRHFVNQSILYMKKIWTDLGFQEMQGSFVQTSFKDLDCLFVPQDHPARTMQDTFYLKDPKIGKLPLWYKKVKDAHENGGDTGSTGWGGVWSKEIAEENLLRTHTTVLSAEYLRKIHDKEFNTPIKFFSVNKVFRNEALDWKHLFEFNQVEGIVIDKNANVSHLKGYLREFFGKMGFTDIRMRPAHFPYTEPSFEVDVFDPKRKTWIELGGAGIFRPEVTKTLIGEEIPVLAWGIGMERIIVPYFELNDLRDLYRNDLKQLKRIKKWMR